MQSEFPVQSVAESPECGTERNTIDLLRFALAAIWTELESDDASTENAQTIADEALDLSSQYEGRGKKLSLETGLVSWRSEYPAPVPSAPPVGEREHPRWAKPDEMADIFLCWGEVCGESRDFWWGKDGRIYSGIETRTGVANPKNPDYATFASGYQTALARARELRLPQRAELKARIASLRAARDTATADLEAAERELRAMGGGA